MTRRIGLIIPSSNRMVEQEMVHAYPAGVVAHVARLRMTGPHHVELDQLLPRIVEATGSLMDARCEVVTFHCTATSMEEGQDGERRVLEALAKGGAKQYATTATAIRDALSALGARRLGVITPYDAHKTDHEVAFLEALGHTVVFARGYDLKGSDEYCTTPARFWQEQVVAQARPDVDAYLVSCANVSTFPVLDAIEKAVGKPVISSNQTVVWDGLRRIGWGDTDKCPGSLFRAEASVA
jgi:maleate cis-trans isomerase